MDGIRDDTYCCHQKLLSDGGSYAVGRLQKPIALISTAMQQKKGGLKRPSCFRNRVTGRVLEGHLGEPGLGYNLGCSKEFIII